MKPKKQPNGKYRLRIYDYIDSQGKQHMKSFTAWSKQQCIDMAKDYLASKKDDSDTYTLLFKDAIEQYISSRTNVLSPATIKKYKFLQKNYQLIDYVPIREFTNQILQDYVNSISSTLSYKSVKDRYALITSVIASFCPSMTFKVVLPSKIKTSRYLPENSEVIRCIENANDDAMKLAICLGAYGMMRSGEICAFQKSDLSDDNTLHIHRNMVKGEDGYIIKSPKSYEGDRYVPLPDFVADMIRQMPCNTIGLNPNAITNRWNRLINKLDIPHFRFHDLRHYCCSTYHDMGCSDETIQKIGGWGDSATMRNVYRHAIESSIARQTANVNEYFQKLNKGIS